VADAVIGPIERVVAAIKRREAVTQHRALTVQVVVPLPLREVFAHALTQAIHGPVALEPIAANATGRERVRTLNRERDLAASYRVLCLVLSHAADLRFVRQHAPDLASFMDLSAEVREEDVGDWPAVAERICAVMTGIAPDASEPRSIPLADVYIPLVDLPIGRDDRPYLLLGHPGSGKTTALRHVAGATCSGRDPLNVGACVAVLIPLADLAEDRSRVVRPLGDFLVDWLGRQGIEGAGVLRQHWGKTTLLWDGLDEVVVREERLAILRELAAFHRKHRPAASLITGRSLLVDELRTEEAKLVRISPAEAVRPVDDASLRWFVGRFLKAWDATSTDPQSTDADALVDRIQADPALLALCRTPLLLLFLVLLYQLDGRLPDQRTAIYHRLAQVLVDRWGAARSLSRNSHTRMRSGDAWRVLGPLAFSLLESGGARMHRADLRAELVRIAVHRGEDEDDAADRADALLALLQRETALLVPHGSGEWSFVHPTVAEYFAGVEVSRDSGRRRDILDDPFRADYHEILVFCTGELGMRADDERLTELVTELVKRSRSKGRYTAAHPSLLAHILQEEPGLPVSVERVLVDRLMEFWWVRSFYNYPSLRVRSEARDLLWDGLDRSYSGVLGAELRRRFSPSPSGVRWDRLVANVRDGRQMTSLLAWTLPLLSRYGIDWRPTFEVMCQHHDPVVRWAGWWGRWQQAGANRDDVQADLLQREPDLQRLYAAVVPSSMSVPSLSG
jgi:hypothetical protein